MQAMLHSSIQVFLSIICTSLYYSITSYVLDYVTTPTYGRNELGCSGSRADVDYKLLHHGERPSTCFLCTRQCRQNEWSGRSLAYLLPPVPAAAFPTKSSHCSGESGQASFCVSDSIVSYSFILFRYFQIGPIDHHFCADTGNESHGQRK